MNFARGLALALDVPFNPVNHLEGHVHSVWLTQDPASPVPELPLLVLIASGGHTELLLMPEHGEYRLLGRTLDDAAGEAFDKVARLLGLEYPGGPAIQRIAPEATAPAPLPRARLRGTFDFSFSGLKTAVLHTVFETAEGRSANEVRGRPLARADLAAKLTRGQIADIAAGFQESVVDALTSKTVEAVSRYDPASVAVVGGVAANRALRERMHERVDRPLFISAPEFSTDNGAMIASAAYFVRRPADDGDVLPGLELAELSA
jgi:N6-L-threonylcarbamoyladenine synthase